MDQGHVMVMAMTLAPSLMAVTLERLGLGGQAHSARNQTTEKTWLLPSLNHYKLATPESHFDSLDVHFPSTQRGQ